jgi:hypothetical protein
MEFSFLVLDRTYTKESNRTLCLIKPYATKTVQEHLHAFLTFVTRWNRLVSITQRQLFLQGEIPLMDRSTTYILYRDGGTCRVTDYAT